MDFDKFSFCAWRAPQILLGPGELTAGEATGTYSTRSFATISDIGFPGLYDVSFWGVPQKYHRSLVSFAAHRRKLALSQQARKSVITWPAHKISTWLHGAQTGLDVLLPATVTDLESILVADSENKHLCVKCELRTQSCTQSKTPRTFWSGMATQSRLIVIILPWFQGPCTMRVVNWITWNVTKTKNKQTKKKLALHHTRLETIHILYKCCRARKTTAEEQNEKLSPFSGRLFVGDRSSCHCSCTKTGTTPYKPPLRSLSSTPSPKAHLSNSPLKNCKQRFSSPPVILLGRNSWVPVLQ